MTTTPLRKSIAISLISLSLAATPASAAAGPSPVFRSVIPKLQKARIPVYLPSWLPAFGARVYPFVFFSSGRRGVEVDLSFSPQSAGTAALAFYITANMDTLSPGPHARQVSLGHGVTGYVGSMPGTAVDSLSIRWRTKGIVYAIGRLGGESSLIRAARSVVQVH